MKELPFWKLLISRILVVSGNVAPTHNRRSETAGSVLTAAAETELARSLI